ncbi:hypothetical protein AAV94_09205 [Lampropedia cohaerens]|uniref:Toxin CptA n=2 Tax=Lampropedia cohaerens TaxID=1610491 RepID=A0A0U1PZ49_9BURK|nr:hypothetical protein AAV94_09205 [Lampropedia cohaerens]
MARHGPIAVSFPVKPHARALRYALISSLVSLLALILIAYQTWTARSSAALWMLAALWLLSVVLMVRQWRAFVPGHLHWQQGQWLWQRTGAASAIRMQVRLVWDGQHRLLLHCKAGGNAPTWLWLERSMAPHLWSDLRRALHHDNGRTHTPTPAPGP